MKIKVIFPGKTDPLFIASVEEYINRMKQYVPFEMIILSEIKTTPFMTPDRIMEKEKEQMLKQLLPGEEIILLDERGNTFSSREFAGFIQKKMNSGLKTLAFLAGGPYGFSPRIREIAASGLSLSKMTFSHQVVRVLFMEQLYRAMAILHNEPYHHD